MISFMLMATPDDVLRIARKEIGYKESPPNSNINKFGAWYGHDGVAWCAMFVSYCTYNAGIPLPAESRLGFKYCPAGVNWFRNLNKFVGRNDPEVGDIVFFSWKSDGWADHVGIIEGINSDGTIQSIEGNTSYGDDSNGGIVMSRKRSKQLILGYGRPDYNDTSLPPSPPSTSYPAWPGRYIALTSPLMTGDDIKTWQTQIIARGYDIGSSGADGIFGEKSYTALLNFQNRFSDRLKVDGIIGPSTWNATWEFELRSFAPTDFTSPFGTTGRAPENLITDRHRLDFSYYTEPWRAIVGAPDSTNP